MSISSQYAFSKSEHMLRLSGAGCAAPLRRWDDARMVDDSALARVAELYYVEQMSQEAVGRALGMSRQKVSRLLKRALETGVVRIEISSPQDTTTRLRQDITRLMRVPQAIVVAPERGGSQAALRAVARTAAAEVVHRIKEANAELVGIGRGATLLELSRAIPRQHLPGLQVVQMVGSVPSASGMPDSAVIASNVAEALGAQPRTYMAPLFLDSPGALRVVEDDSNVGDIRTRAARVDIAVFSIGRAIDAGQLFPTESSRIRALEELSSLQAVGEICGRFFREDGTPLDGQLAERSFAIRLPDLKAVNLKICVAAGASKADAVAAGVRGGYVDVLIVDTELGRRLVELA
jgi:deoxyribonucleoside regulator